MHNEIEDGRYFSIYKSDFSTTVSIWEHTNSKRFEVRTNLSYIRFEAERILWLKGWVCIEVGVFDGYINCYAVHEI